MTPISGRGKFSCLLVRRHVSLDPSELASALSFRSLSSDSFLFAEILVKSNSLGRLAEIRIFPKEEQFREKIVRLRRKTVSLVASNPGPIFA